MLLYSIQKTANFQHNGDKALNAHRIVVPMRYGCLVGLVSLYVVWVWQYLWIVRDAKAHHYFIGGGND